MTEQERAVYRVARLMDEMEEGEIKFNEWEINFINSIADNLAINPDYPLSDKQIAVINRLYKE